MNRFEVVLLQAAQADYLEAYERGGERFDQQVETGLELLAAFPEIAPKFRTKYRRLVLAKIGYGVFYQFTGRRVIISAILHLSQEPKRINDRLK